MVKNATFFRNMIPKPLNMFEVSKLVFIENLLLSPSKPLMYRVIFNG
jgi:hypothetical protein